VATYCIMPNHVHVLLQPLTSETQRPTDETHEDGEREDSKSVLGVIMHSLKSYTAHEANKILRREGQFWQHESYDHWIRDDDELERVVNYIMANLACCFGSPKCKPQARPLVATSIV
jgi:putative transposase